ncbi:xylose isomerase [Neobacillus bataviensis LMG 21833]|uniref:Xylose isomerase n=1 Tax=Neobacillus bataviensis LMG 21833 TaxID=1117379 RepID=K6DB49_9BACI|nr:TIM barrel protein [Neobacillus bataviensis]EKN69767.1 xylose isomerase [Neobacillus bataviensis LMG 21833]
MFKLKKIYSLILTTVMLIALMPFSAIAETNPDGEGVISIRISNAGGGLKEAVDSIGIGYKEITSLTITDGILNGTDTKFINESLTSLLTFELVDKADFENSTVPEKAFEENQSLQTVKFLNTKILGGRAFYQGRIGGGNLKAVELPKLTAMGNRAFYRTTITSLTLGEEPPEMLPTGYWFKDVQNLTIYVPTEEAILKYKDNYEFMDFRIKLIGDLSEDDDVIDENQFYDYKYDKNLDYQYTGEYYTGDYKVSLNLYSYNVNLNAWRDNKSDGPPPIDTFEAIRAAKKAGFDAVDITAYYIPGYDNKTMPTKSDEEIYDFVKRLKDLCKELGMEISGTGVQNDFADTNAERRALDVERIKYWIDVAAEMGAPVMRVFSGDVPKDIKSLGWETIARDRIAPPLREIAEYGASKGVKIGLQNHGDMTSTAGQIIQILNWVDHPNIGIINDTGYFRNFRSNNYGYDYNWYHDMRAALPYTNNFQVKKKTAGQETDVKIDMDRLFTDVRNSSYRGYIPVELLWVPGDEGHPNTLTEPPHEEISRFLGLVKESLEATKTSPRVKNIEVLGKEKLNLGEKNQVIVNGIYRDNSKKLQTENITYHSSDPSVASINSEGLVTALSEGETVITAEYDTFRKKYLLNVKDPSLVKITTADLEKMLEENNLTITFEGKEGELRLPTAAAEMLGNQKLDVMLGKATWSIDSTTLSEVADLMKKQEIADGIISFKVHRLSDEATTSLLESRHNKNGLIEKVSDIFQLTLDGIRPDGSTVNVNQLKKPLHGLISLGSKADGNIVGIYDLGLSGEDWKIAKGKKNNNEATVEWLPNRYFAIAINSK